MGHQLFDFRYILVHTGVIIFPYNPSRRSVCAQLARCDHGEHVRAKEGVNIFQTKVNLEKDSNEMEGIGLPGEDHAEEQSTLFGHFDDSSGTKAEEETKFSRYSATAEAEGEANCEAYHVNNGENMETCHVEQAVIKEQFVPEEVSAIL